MIELYPYQKQAIDALNNNRKLSNKLILSLTVGLGKTITASWYIENELKNNGLVVVLMHTNYLVEQFVKEGLKVVNPKMIVGIDQGKNKIPDNVEVVVSTMQSFIRRKEKYNPKKLSALVIDESHRASGDTYTDIIKWAGLYKKDAQKDWNKKALLLGLTATPFRGNSKENLKEVFDEIAFSIDIKDAIKKGLACNIDLSRVKTNIPINVRQKLGDYNAKELNKSIDTPFRNKIIVDAYKEKAIEGQTLVFASSIEHSRNLANMFKIEGVNADYVDSLQNKLEQNKVIKNFKSGSLDVLCNVTLFTEGFNHKPIKNVILARPTMSPVLMVQMVGRGTRIMEGKDRVKIIDVMDTWKKNNPLSVSKLFGFYEDEEEINVKEKIEKNDKGVRKVIQKINVPMHHEIIDEGLLVSLLDEVKEDLLGKFVWIKTDEDEWVLGVGKTETENGEVQNLIFRLKYKLSSYSLSYECVFKNKKVESFIGDFNSIEVVEKTIKKLISGKERLVMSNQNWRDDKVTDKQKSYIINLLKKKSNKVSIDNLNISKGDAQILINLLNL